MGATLLQRHWSNGCFILLRRLFGLNQELLVLLMPEMIAKRFFRALHDGVSDPALRAVFAQMTRRAIWHFTFAFCNAPWHSFCDGQGPSTLPLAAAVPRLLRGGND